MKTIVCIVSTLLVIQVQYAVGKPMEKWLAALDKCKTKEGVDGAFAEAMKDKKLPETEEGKCLLACIFEEFGILSNNVYNKEGALSVADRMFADKPEKLEKAKMVIETCAREVGETSGNRCEVAFKIGECAKRNGDFDSY